MGRKVVNDSTGKGIGFSLNKLMLAYIHFVL